MPGAVYSPFADKLNDPDRKLFALHVGDTSLEPCDALRMSGLDPARHPGLYSYTDTRGLPKLIDAILDKVRDRNGLTAERTSVLVTAGATAGLQCVAGAVVDPGDEVLILAPFWPLIRCIVQSFGGKPVEVPFFDRVSSAEEAVAAVRQRITSRTVALYVSTPSNPTGKILPREWLEALAELARSADLWLWSDETYEDYVYEGEHFSVGALVPDRTVSVYSFSKAYGVAGLRVGYLVAPAALIDQARKLGTHSFYAAPTPSQYAALGALQGGAAWIRGAREQYRDVGTKVAALLGLPAPRGSTFLFVDVSKQLDARGMMGLLSDCFESGVLIAPGASCGTDYADWIRLCYTAIPPAAALEAVQRLVPHLRTER